MYKQDTSMYKQDTSRFHIRVLNNTSFFNLVLLLPPPLSHSPPPLRLTQVDKADQSNSEHNDSYWSDTNESINTTSNVS